MPDGNEFLNTLERSSRLAFELGYKYAIDALESSAANCPENSKAFSLSARMLKAIKDVYYQKNGKSLAEDVIPPI